MAERKIDYEKLIDMVTQKKMSQAEIANIMGVNPSTVTRAIQRLKRHVTRTVMVRSGDKYQEAQFRVWDEFKKNFDAVNKFCEALEAYNYKGDKTVFVEMQRKVESKSVEQGEGEPKDGSKKGKGKNGKKKSRVEQKIEHLDFSIDPRALMLKSYEVREKSVMDGFEIVKEIMDFEQVRSFMNDMLQLMLRRADQETKNEIQEALRRHELVRSYLSLDSDNQGDMRD
jgi:predicted XRE-type DNA-binding protein